MKNAATWLLMACITAYTSWLHADPPTPSYEQELSKLSTELGESLSESHVKTIAIPNFTDLDGGETDLGGLLTQDLTIDLVNQNKGISIIDTSSSNQSDNQPKIDATLVGTIIPLGTSYRIEVKVVATDSGKLLAAKRFLMARTDELDGMMGIQETIVTTGQKQKPAPFPKNAPIPQSGLTLWLNAGTGVKADSDKRVSEWIDRSGLGNNACQLTPTERPVLLPGNFHGKPVIQFDGSTYLATNSVVTSGQDYSVFVVSTLGGIDGPFYNGDSGASGWGFNRTQNTQAYGLCNGGSGYGVFGAIQNQSDYQLLSATRGSGITSFYAYGTLMGTDNFGMAPPAGVSFVGSINPTNNGNFSGNIAELIVYDHKLSDEERQSVERYLAVKYDLKLEISLKKELSPKAVPPPVIESADKTLQ